jgi:hypothetical protein
MSLFSNRPAASSPEALDKVFEIARAHFGCMDAEEADNWREWIDSARGYARYSAHRARTVTSTEK